MEPTAPPGLVNAPRHLPAGLYALCDDGFLPHLPLEQKAQWLLEGGVRVLQLRLKRTPDRPALVAARAIAARCRASGALCLVNDRVDLALLADADGVHLGADDLPPDEARRVLGPSALIGVTARDARGISAAAAAGADYVGVGPLFGTSTKVVDAPVLGLDALRLLVGQSPLPVVAIAGIDRKNIADVAAAGVHGAAVLSGLLGAEDIPRRARELAQAFERGRRTFWDKLDQ